MSFVSDAEVDTSLVARVVSFFLKPIYIRVPPWHALKKT